MKAPLADRLRPAKIEDVMGQSHLLGKGRILHNILETGNIPNMIFYGPSGTGKTTVANIAARLAGGRLHKLNATNASVGDIKAIVGELDGILGMGGVILYLDEIQNFNKKQQQSLLEYIENGKITLIASTTENPHFYIYNAILSRSTVFEFMPLCAADIIKTIERAADVLAADIAPMRLKLDGDAAAHIAEASNGDVRRALNAVEIAVSATPPDTDGVVCVTLCIAEECVQKKSFRYDRDGDSHYDILSAFQKSIRGSDPDAALHYLARLISGGDLISICRRLLVMAAEDIGLAYPIAITIVKSCVDAARELGFPEAQIPLAQAVTLLATAPKSNASCVAIGNAMADLQSRDTGDIPLHLKDSHYGGASGLGRGIAYKYPHDYPNNYVSQQYLPDNIKNARYYTPGGNKFEQANAEYWRQIMTASKKPN